MVDQICIEMHCTHKISLTELCLFSFDLQDPELLAEINEYKQRLEDVVNRYVGRTVVKLQGSPPGDLVCRKQECNMGNLITDAMVWKYLTSFDDSQWNDVSIAVFNGGGIRASIERGNAYSLT